MAPELLAAPSGTSTRRKITPPQYAKQLGVYPTKVLQWIRSGELPAMNVSTDRRNKPRYVIDVADIAVFEASRAVQPPAPRVRRRRTQPGVTEFF